MMKAIIYIVVSLISVAVAKAAEKDPYAVLQQLQDFYASAKHLRFEMRYQYSATSNPGRILDSMKGSIAISKQKFRVVIDSSETIVNDRSMIQVIHREKLLVVASRSRERQDKMTPLHMVDSSLMKNSLLKLSLTETGGQRILHITFPEGGMYKTADLILDAGNTRIVRAIYEVKTEALLPVEALTAVTGSQQEEPYSFVSVDYRNYNTDPFDPGVFDEQNYVRKVNGVLTPVEAFAGYSIYNADPKQF